MIAYTYRIERHRRVGLEHGADLAESAGGDVIGEEQIVTVAGLSIQIRRRADKGQCTAVLAELREERNVVAAGAAAGGADQLGGERVGLDVAGFRIAVESADVDLRVAAAIVYLV